MTTTAVRNDIADTLAAVPGTDWPAGAAAVLAAMGYRSELVLQDQTGDPADFIGEFYADNLGTQTEQRFLKDAQSVQARLPDNQRRDRGRRRSVAANEVRRQRL